VAWFTENAETYEIEIVDPDDETVKATITCKRLSAGDHADVVDAMHDDESGEGHVRFLIVERAVTGWSLPEAFSPAMLAGLKPEVFLQIWAGIREEDVNPFGRAARLAASLKQEPEASTTTDDPATAEPAAAGVESQTS
jgi:hypothetical protein